MDYEAAIDRLRGCFLAIPTYFHEDFSLNLDALRRVVRFALDGGLCQGNATILVNGATGEFPVLSLVERKQTAETVVDAAQGRVTVIVGAQTSSTLEAMDIARHAQEIGAGALQVSPPFYYPPTDDDVYGHFEAIAEAAPEIPIVAYNTYWLGYGFSLETLERLATIPQVAAVKWGCPNTLVHALAFDRFAGRLGFIDNQLQTVYSVLKGGIGANLHPAMFWPEWGVKVWDLLRAHKWEEAQAEVERVLFPFYELYGAACAMTGGEGHVDKLALELVGLPPSPNRPPTRPLPASFQERVRELLMQIGAPMNRV